MCTVQGGCVSFSDTFGQREYICYVPAARLSHEDMSATGSESTVLARSWPRLNSSPRSWSNSEFSASVKRKWESFKCVTTQKGWLRTSKKATILQRRRETTPTILSVYAVTPLYSGHLCGVLIREVSLIQWYVVLYTSLCSWDSRNCPH